MTEPQTPGAAVTRGSAAVPGTTPPQLTITVRGTPAAKGSKNRGRHSLYESSKAVAPWTEAVRAEAINAETAAFHARSGATCPLEGPVSVQVTFTVRKPAGAPKRRVSWPTKRPDIDKYLRSTLDGITAAGTWRDDAQVVELTATKVYPGEGVDALTVPGAVIRVWRVGEEP